MIQVFDTKQDVAQAAAKLLLETATEAISKNGRFLVALSGGSTPALLYELLNKRPYAEKMPWQDTHIFWGDERLVPPTNDGSNFKQAKNILLQNVPIPEENIHRAKGELSPADAVPDYLAQLKAVSLNDGALPIFDLVLLGMGGDGHTASLFPGAIQPIERETAVISVTANYDGRPANRISFTPLLINKSKNILVLITGENKAATVNEVLNGETNLEKWPIQRIQPSNGTLYWYLDQAAAQNSKID
ncbi:MAG: 6-phosphogluconolactonase [Chloroflexota bacterium]